MLHFMMNLILFIFTGLDRSCTTNQYRREKRLPSDHRRETDERTSHGVDLIIQQTRGGNELLYDLSICQSRPVDTNHDIIKLGKEAQNIWNAIYKSQFISHDKLVIPVFHTSGGKDFVSTESHFPAKFKIYFYKRVFADAGVLYSWKDITIPTSIPKSNKVNRFLQHILEVARSVLYVKV
jgi:hypothetical protein